MGPRVLYAACSLPAWVEMAQHLHAQHGWAPCYWAGRPQLAELVRQAFPTVVFHAHDDAVRGVAPEACATLDLPALDESLLRRLAPHESIALKMMDRLDYPGEMTHGERRRLYYWNVRYWLAVLERYRPDVMFNVSTPHQVYDYVLYVLCRELGIRTILMGIAFDVNLVFGKADYRDGSGEIAAIYRLRLETGNGPEEPALSAESEAALRRLTGSYADAMPALISAQLAVRRPSDHRAFYARAIRHTPAYVRLAATAALGVLSPVRRHWRASGPARSRLAELLHTEVTGPLRLDRLRRHYDGLARDVDLDRPYVYLPIAYQPEMSSSPEGGMFVEQFLMVSMLSEALPEGWRIYVREHPLQFSYAFGTNRCVRSHAYYEELNALPNVEIARVSLTPFDLIDRAQAVATVTGTSGWEALVREIPVLYFGYPWWQGCEGAFYTPTLAATREALARIQAGYKIDHEKVRRFVRVVEEESCSGDLYTKRDLQPLTSAEHPRIGELAREMARVVHRFHAKAGAW